MLEQRKRYVTFFYEGFNTTQELKNLNEIRFPQAAVGYQMFTRTTKSLEDKVVFTHDSDYSPIYLRKNKVRYVSCTEVDPYGDGLLETMQFIGLANGSEMIFPYCSLKFQ